MSYTIERYTPQLAKEWDEFVSRSKNGTFLFMRGYMDYHADRFSDFSLIARDRHGKIAAILPSNAAGEQLHSHQGLTYGGWIAAYKGFDVLTLLEIQHEAEDFLRAAGFRSIIYKRVPYIYSEIPSEEDLYMLFRRNATLIASGVSGTVNLATDCGLDMSQRRKARKAVMAGVTVRECDSPDCFWAILSEVLASRHNTRPVHTLDEIKLLKSRFPENIRFFGAYMPDGEMVAGTVLYVSRGVAHAQYIAASEKGRSLNALPLLFESIMDLCRKEGCRWFDYGISTENGGRYLNEGLARQKITLGSRAVVYETYLIPL